MIFSSALISIIILFYSNIGLNFHNPVVSLWSKMIQKESAEFSQSFKKTLFGNEAFAVIGLRTENRIATLPPSPPSHFPVKFESVADFSTVASSAVVLDNDNDDVLFDKNADQQQPIASITKLMTALVFLEHNPGWDKIYEVQKSDRREGGKIYLFNGEKVKVKDLFHLSLVGSGNTETIGLVRSTGMTEDEFVQKMNDKAKELGLQKTSFADAVGLTEKNVSTAKEIALFAKVALAKPDILKATLTKKYEFATEQGQKKTVHSTDELLSMSLPDGIKLMGGKTGFTEQAGYCFVSKFADQDNNQVISVILDGPDKESRFTQTHDLISWIYKSYRWK